MDEEGFLGLVRLIFMVPFIQAYSQIILRTSGGSFKNHESFWFFFVLDCC